MHSSSWARAAPGRAQRPSKARRWRRHGRRAQVAPVATLLGLLLVVTYLATYLATTLPNQMSVNDLDHETQVVNQIGQLATVASDMASVGIIGAEGTFPVTLGSAGTPPFAGPDSASIGPITGWTGVYGMYVNYSLNTPTSTRLNVSAASNPGAGIVVSLHNTYASAAEVAYDDGATIYAEPGGVPVMTDPPAISLSSGNVLSVLVPVFLNPIGSESGTTNAEVGLRLTAVQALSVPFTGYSFRPGVPVNITAFTPYASAWMSYFSTNPAFAHVSISCTPTGSGTGNVCSSTYLYHPGGPIGKVLISVTPAALAVTQAYYAVSLS